jgi:hypothetical protein
MLLYSLQDEHPLDFLLQDIAEQVVAINRPNLMSSSSLKFESISVAVCIKLIRINFLPDFIPVSPIPFFDLFFRLVSLI